MAERSARQLALAALTEWRTGRDFADSIIQRLLGESTLGGSDRGFATELFYGVLRNLTLLDFWIAQLRSGALDHASRDLLRIGLYQLFCLRTPSHAAVNETVELAGRRNRSLINAVLRTAVRRLDELQGQANAEDLATRASHPEFLIARWTATFGSDAAQTLCDWNNQPAPVYARINSLRISAKEFFAGNTKAEPLPGKGNFVRVAAFPSDALQKGNCYIQDPSTATACELLDPQPGESVLDACASPGGKSGLIAELMQNRGELTAVDRDAARVEVLRCNLERLGVSIARVIRHDWRSNAAAEPHCGAFDRILIDAPCTNTGVMRRRVDLRWRLQPGDFARMPDEQLAFTRAVIPLLKAGGRLVYSTCSIEPEENAQVVEQIVAAFPFMQLEETRSVLPFRDQFDGAYAARFLRAP
jgi:16S rRNA (cytosine967-C5)-methyltransferase